jgi:hypothetical protein
VAAKIFLRRCIYRYGEPAWGVKIWSMSWWIANFTLNIPLKHCVRPCTTCREWLTRASKILTMQVQEIFKLYQNNILFSMCFQSGQMLCTEQINYYFHFKVKIFEPMKLYTHNTGQYLYTNGDKISTKQWDGHYLLHTKT